MVVAQPVDVLPKSAGIVRAPVRLDVKAVRRAVHRLHTFEAPEGTPIKHAV